MVLGTAALLATPLALTTCPAYAAAAPQTEESVVRINLDSNGNQILGYPESQANWDAVDYTGKHIVFADIRQLTPDDTAEGSSVYLRDLENGTTTLVSTDAAGQSLYSAWGASISDDGQLVAFRAGSTGVGYVKNLATGALTQISLHRSSPYNQIGDPIISGDGKHVCFQSYEHQAPNEPAENYVDVYLRDLEDGTVDWISQAPGRTAANGTSQNCRVSDDGRYVLFQSSASNLVAGDTNGKHDMFVRDRVAGTTTRVSLDSRGNQIPINTVGGALSGNGRYFEFYSYARLVDDDLNDVPDIYRRDLVTGEFLRVTPDPMYGGIGTSAAYCGMSRDGSVVAFQSDRSYHPADTNHALDTYTRRFPGGTPVWMSAPPGDTTTAWSQTGCVAISGDGTTVLYRSSATNLVPGDTNGRWDLFAARGLGSDSTAPVVTARPDRAPNAAGWYNAPVIIYWDAVDPGNEASPPTVPPDTVAATEGSGVEYISAPSCDQSGNCATGTARVSLDTEPPVLTVTGVADAATYQLGTAPVPGCTAADSLSGIAEGCAGTLTGGVDNGVGVFGYDMKATDVAGNRGTGHVSYQVVYPWTGFLPPIGTSGHAGQADVSFFKAGATVPVKLRITNAAGAVVSSTASPRWMAPQRLGPIGSPIPSPPALSPSATVLRQSGDTWILNWSTRDLAAGYYYRIGVLLDDGTVHDAVIGLR